MYVEAPNALRFTIYSAPVCNLKDSVKILSHLAECFLSQKLKCVYDRYDYIKVYKETLDKVINLVKDIL